ncbi:MAG: acyl carrier protein [Gemmataceae bacterium]
MSDRSELIQQLQVLLEEETGEEFAEVQEANSLREDLGLDSVDLVSAVTQIERQYRISLTREDLEKLVTVKDVVDMMQAKLAPVGPPTE